MTWPTIAVNTTNCDTSADSPALFRSDVLDAIQKLNQIIAIPPLESFASGVRLPFAQAAAPTGWTQDTTDAATNRMLRVVNTAGGGTGGVTGHSPILMNVVPSHTHASSGSTGAMSANATHTHTDSGHSHPITAQRQGNSFGGITHTADFNTATPSTGTGYAAISTTNTDHTHTFSGTTDGGSSSTNWQPRYIDLIICTKN